MRTTIHQSNTRGHKSIDWLDSKHTFSFSDYYNPERIHFGALRVLNDDTVAPGEGFGTHPHRDMEIISIPLSGDLAHKDSMGNEKVIHEGEIQAMSAGTGITHSEYNYSNEVPVKFLQIWLIPNKTNLEPRYSQLPIKDLAKPNNFYQVLSPNPNDEGVWIHQDAWFYMADLQKGHSAKYDLKNTANGVYAFVIAGDVEINGQALNERDGLGIEETDAITAIAKTDAKILLMEVPMLKL